MKQTWKPIKGFKGYEISNLGNVRSFFRRIGLGVGNFGCQVVVDMSKRPTYKRFGLVKGNYHTISLSKNGIVTRHMVSRLVAEAFIGPAKKGLECAHINGDSLDNRASNLAWVTPKENQSHRKSHGTEYVGERHHGALFTNDQIREIRLLFKSGIKNREIARRFKCSDATASRIVRGKLWKHVT